MGKKIRIGYISTAYTSKRNFLWATDNKYVSLRPFYRLTLRYWMNKFFKVRYEGYHGHVISHYFYDVAHFFNTISFDKHPWITTGGGPVPWFEKELHEFLYAGMDINAVSNKKLLEKGIAACASPYCKHIFINSNCSMMIQKKLLSAFPEYEQRILDKVSVLYPPQALIVQSLEEKLSLTSSNSKLTFIFIGHDFYRKGGLVVLRVFENLSKQFDNFQVITVGSLRNDVPAIFDKSMEKETRELIGKYNGKWLTHYNTLPNNEVLELIKRADVGLLPTYSDVFGYSCLEFQACGCPVISSDVRAMPEINNNDCGWMMEIGIKTKHRELANIKQVIRTCEMEHKLQHIVESILLQGEIPRAKIQKSIERIVKYHSPEQHKYILQQTYLKATKNE